MRDVEFYRLFEQVRALEKRVEVLESARLMDAAREQEAAGCAWCNKDEPHRGPCSCNPRRDAQPAAPEPVKCELATARLEAAFAKVYAKGAEHLARQAEVIAEGISRADRASRELDELDL